MQYYYSTFRDVITTHSGITTDEYGIPCVNVHFERPSRHDDNTGFDFADGRIPHFIFYKAFGFSEDELFRLKEYMKNNSSLIWEFAEKGGGKDA